MIIDKTQTIVVEPHASATILSRHVILNVQSVKNQIDNATVVDPIKLSIFGHRFMSVADQMSRMFQKTSVSTNIKERLDFSCAVFSPDGKLVANAPNVPVHLGSKCCFPYFSTTADSGQSQVWSMLCGISMNSTVET